MVDKISSSSVVGYQNGSTTRKNPALQAYENTPGNKNGAGSVQQNTRNHGARKASDARKTQDAGVILDLSTNKKVQPKPEGEKPVNSKTVEPKTGEQESAGFFGAVRRFFGAIVQWMINFWNSDSTQGQKATQEGAAEADFSTSEKQPEAIIPASSSEQSQAQPSKDAETIKPLPEADEELPLPEPMDKKRSLTETLMKALSRGIISLDDLDTAQIGVLIEEGINVEEIADGIFDFAAYFAPPPSEKMPLPAEGQELAEVEEIMDELPPLDAGISEYGPDLQDIFRSGSLERIEEIVTQNGAKRLAHNTDLLTYYDRKGRLVELDDTQKHRVLFGDRNILKL